MKMMKRSAHDVLDDSDECEPDDNNDDCDDSDDHRLG